MTTVNVSFPKQLLKAMDAIAKRKSCSRSELLRVATRLYIERQQRWEQLSRFWQGEARRLKLKPEDVDRMIAEVRRSNGRAS